MLERFVSSLFESPAVQMLPRITFDGDAFGERGSARSHEDAAGQYGAAAR